MDKNKSTRETYDRLKKDLKALHNLALTKPDQDNWREMMKLMRDIHTCTMRLEPHLDEPLKADLFGIVDDFKDYTPDSSREDRHEFCDYLNKNIDNIFALLDHLKTKAA